MWCLVYDLCGVWCVMSVVCCLLFQGMARGSPVRVPGEFRGSRGIPPGLPWDSLRDSVGIPMCVFMNECMCLCLHVYVWWLVYDVRGVPGESWDSPGTPLDFPGFALDCMCLRIYVCVYVCMYVTRDLCV